MPLIYNYDLYIFDCDGVILNSNALKVQAMEETLIALSFKPDLVAQCVEYFAKNFGKSRFHHIAHFIKNILNIEDEYKISVEHKILTNFSRKCRLLYLKAEITPGFLTFIESLPGKKYIASGSEQSELREVFRNRKLDLLFNDIYGSPTQKVELVSNIVRLNGSSKAIMFGDALSDMNAAIDNGIDFVAYIPYSNVKEEMKKQCISKGYAIINSWMELQ